MALVAGTATIEADGSVSGTGLAFALASGRRDFLELTFESLENPPPVEARIPLYQQQAALANVDAQAIVAHITANAVVTVVIPTSAGGAGLQRTPNPNNPDTATQAPSAQKTLNGTIA